jgi:alpha-1,6-mannosyltransferase
MKIADVAEFYSDKGGGVKTYIDLKLEAGSKNGHEVIIVAPGAENKTENRSGGKIIWVKSPPIPIDPRYYFFNRQKHVHEILNSIKPDIVEGSSPWTGGWMVANWKGNSVKSFIFHQDPVAVYPETYLGNIIGYENVNRLFFWYWQYLRKLSKKYDITVTSGIWLADKLKSFGITNAQAVSFGIDKKLFSESRKNDALKKELLRKCNAPENGRLIVTISRFHPEKRLKTLIEAFKIFSAKNKDAGYLIIGDGAFKKQIEKKAKETDRIHFFGFTKDRILVSNILASSDLMIHGSGAETYGLVVAEAICSGLPAVVPDRGGAYDLSSEEYSEVYKLGNASSCADAIERIFERNKEHLKINLRQVSEKICDIDNHFQNLFRKYEEEANKKGELKL